jgi:hypothetical protein
MAQQVVSGFSRTVVVSGFSRTVVVSGFSRTLFGTLIAALLLPVMVAGQAVYNRDRAKEPGAKSWLERKAKLPAFSPPRMPDGKPNLQGRWGGSSSGDVIEETEYIDVTTPPAESWIADPPDGKLPYQPWALAERNKHRAGLSRGWPGEDGTRLYADPQTYCLKSVPRYAQRGFELIQQPNQVVQMLNWGHYWRSIPIDGRPHPASTAKFWLGNPRARWDGDTLVVDVTNLNGKMWLDSVGNFYSDNARVTERFRLVEANTLDYEVTIDDPTVFTRTFKLSYPLRRQGAGGGCAECGAGNAQGAAKVDPYEKESWEHACHEGNGHHIEGTKELGFKWYLPPAPPGR